MNDFQKNELKELKKLLIENNLTRHGRNRLILFIETLEQQLQQKEDIINKAREYIKKEDLYEVDFNLHDATDKYAKKDLLEILDNKGEMKDE